MKFVVPFNQLLCLLALVFYLTNSLAAQDTINTVSLTCKTEPGTIIWVDSLRYGTVTEGGEMTLNNLSVGAHTVRARLKGRREIAQGIKLSGEANLTIQLDLSKLADKAELNFQSAEELRGIGKHTEAIDLYRLAIELRGGNYPVARLGLARSLLSNENYSEAVAEARKALREKRGVYPEAHTVIGNIKRIQGLYDDALTSYHTSLKQTNNFSPEAHTGTAMIYQDRNLSEEAIKHFQTAIAQANDTEPIVYFLLGSILEREYRNKEAVESYEKYLRLQPNTTQASALRSVLKQLRREIR
ncbi:MAG: tetratricopeptide repeat protein [Acidobacteria bacterium]|nr:tetratricopeptide repeat protein [Acidobacteriota bacterium]